MLLEKGEYHFVGNKFANSIMKLLADKTACGKDRQKCVDCVYPLYTCTEIKLKTMQAYKPLCI
jgi:Zn-finger protein